MVKTEDVSKDAKYSFETKYRCKELLTKLYYDPVLSGEMIQFIYNRMMDTPHIKINSYGFNDIEKFIDIDFDITIPRTNTTYIYNVIYDSFKDFYKFLIFDNKNYFKLYQIDNYNCELFKDVVMFNVNDICSQKFSCFTILLMINDEKHQLFRIKLV